MPRSEIYKRILSLFLGLAGIVLLAFGALVAWVMTGPRSLDSFTPYIESALAEQGMRVKIGHAMLLWEGWSHPVGIRVKDVDLMNTHGAPLVHFPEVGVRMYFFEMLRGKLDLKSIELLGPSTRLVQDENGDIKSFGLSGGTGADANNANASIPALLVLLTSDAGDNPITHLKSFSIQHASLSIEDHTGKPFITSGDASLEIMRKSGVATGELKMPLEFNGSKSGMEIKFTIDGQKKAVTSDIALTNMPSGILHALAPKQEVIDGIQMPLSGTAKILSDFDANIEHVDFDLEAGAGTVTLPDQLEKPLSPKRIVFKGVLSDHLTSMQVDEATIIFPGHSVSFAGTVTKKDDDYGLDGHVETGNVDIDELHLYWPLKLAPHSRHWVTTRISKGKLIKAAADFHFKPGDFKLKNAPDEDVDAQFAVKGATISYKPSHPSIEDIDGSIRFTGETMDAKIASAQYLSHTHITKARAQFPDFAPDDVKMLISADVDTDAKDVQKFLALPDLNKAERLHLTPEAVGEISGSAKLDFIAFSENDKNDISATGDINYSVSGTLNGGAQKRFMNKRDIENANLKISLDNKGIQLSGKAKVNDVPMDIALKSSFEKDDTQYVIAGELPVSKLSEFDLPKPSFIKGRLGVKATIESTAALDKAEATIDMKHVEVNLPKHAFMKADGDDGTLKFTADVPAKGNTVIHSFAIQGNNYRMSGNAEYDGAIGDFRKFAFDKLQMGGHDLDSLVYALEGTDTVHITARGQSFDITPYLLHTGDEQSSNYVIDIQTARLILGPGREVSDVAAQIQCPADRCKEVHLRMKLKGGAPFTYTIVDGELQANTNDAGELARTLALFSSMDGGKLDLKGKYINGRLEGKLEILGYTIKNAPVLTKMFTIASLTGILNTLTGNGIYFDRLVAPYVYHKGIIVLKDVKTHGGAMGLTADGVIDTNASTLDLAGVLVPSYTLNSIVGNVPLIGSLIQGGSGEGLLALSYGMHGPTSDPSVRVNPLSVLTPGFLRDIFTIFDKPAPDMDAIEAARKKAKVQTSAPAVVVPPVAPVQAEPQAESPKLPHPHLPPVEELHQ